MRAHFVNLWGKLGFSPLIYILIWLTTMHSSTTTQVCWIVSANIMVWHISYGMTYTVIKTFANMIARYM